MSCGAALNDAMIIGESSCFWPLRAGMMMNVRTVSHRLLASVFVIADGMLIPWRFYNE